MGEGGDCCWVIRKSEGRGRAHLLEGQNNVSGLLWLGG